MGAARRPGFPQGAAQIPPGGKGQKRLDRGAGERHGIALLDPPLSRSFGRCRPGELRQAVEVRLSENQAPIPLVVQYILAEQGVEARQPLGDGCHPHLLLGVQQ